MVPLLCVRSCDLPRELKRDSDQYCVSIDFAGCQKAPVGQELEALR